MNQTIIVMEIGVYLMKKLLFATFLTCALVISGCSSDDNDAKDSELIAKSDAGNISENEFYNELKSRYGETVLREMLLKKVLLNTYSLDEDEVEEHVSDAKEQWGENFEMWLIQEGYENEETFRDVITVSLLYDQAIFDGIEVSDDEVKDTYDRMKEEIEARHILVMDEETAKEVKEKLDEGEDFADLATEYSTDPGSSQEGGELGYFSALKMVSEFENAAYSLKIDEISDPVKSEMGYHIIQVTDRRENEQELQPFEEIEEHIFTQLRNRKLSQDEAKEKIDKLILDANIDIQIDEFNFEDLFHINKEDK